MMSDPRTSRLVALAMTLAATVGCATRARVADTPPATTAAAAPAPTAAAPSTDSAPARAGRSAADVRFMRDMIAHHGQALVMTALVPTRTRRDDMRLIAERITISQRDEIAMMRRWLRARGEAVPHEPGDSTHAAHHGGMVAAGAPATDHSAMQHGGMTHGAMPGMLSAEDLARLAASDGPAFDRRFLDGMIRHHEGALAMVATLLATPGAGLDPELFRFVSDVDAEQRAEIRRMQALRATMPAERP